MWTPDETARFTKVLNDLWPGTRERVELVDLLAETLSREASLEGAVAAARALKRGGARFPPELPDWMRACAPQVDRASMGDAVMARLGALAALGAEWYSPKCGTCRVTLGGLSIWRSGRFLPWRDCRPEDLRRVVEEAVVPSDEPVTFRDFAASADYERPIDRARLRGESTPWLERIRSRAIAREIQTVPAGEVAREPGED